MKPGDLVRFTQRKLTLIRKNSDAIATSFEGLAVITKKVEHFPDCWSIKWVAEPHRHESVVYEESLELVSPA